MLIRIHLNSDRTIIGSAGVSATDKQWDSKNGRAIGRSADAIKINKVLEKIEADLVYLFHRFEYDDNLSVDFIKSQYLGKEEDKDSFLAFYDDYLKSIREEVGITRAMASLYFSIIKRGISRSSTFVGTSVFIRLVIIHWRPSRVTMCLRCR